jgi:hypothetical protein
MQVNAQSAGDGATSSSSDVPRDASGEGKTLNASCGERTEGGGGGGGKCVEKSVEKHHQGWQKGVPPVKSILKRPTSINQQSQPELNHSQNQNQNLDELVQKPQQPSHRVSSITALVEASARSSTSSMDAVNAVPVVGRGTGTTVATNDVVDGGKGGENASGWTVNAVCGGGDGDALGPMDSVHPTQGLEISSSLPDDKLKSILSFLDSVEQQVCVCGVGNH